MPSGTLSMRATTPATPTVCSWSGPGSSASGSRLATITSRRSAASTSLISVIERGWPTASGVSVSGKVTVSRSGRTGSVAGSCGLLGRGQLALADRDHGPSRRSGSMRTDCGRAGGASGSSTISIPSSYAALAASASTSAPSDTTRRNGPCSISSCW